MRYKEQAWGDKRKLAISWLMKMQRMWKEVVGGGEYLLRYHHLYYILKAMTPATKKGFSKHILQRPHPAPRHSLNPKNTIIETPTHHIKASLLPPFLRIHHPQEYKQSENPHTTKSVSIPGLKALPRECMLPPPSPGRHHIRHHSRPASASRCVVRRHHRASRNGRHVRARVHLPVR